MKIFVTTTVEKEVTDLTGQKFGLLTVLHERESGSARKNYTKKNIKWLCECECGTKKWIQMPALVCGKAKSCGCTRIKSENRKSYLTARQPENKIIAKYIDGAKRRNLEWHLEHSQLMTLFKSDCNYCGNKPAQIYHGFVFNGIDRIDNTKGYLSNNVVSCCGICNQGKSDMSLDQFYDWINRIHKRRNMI